jgi:hypothetical protein
MTSYKNHPYYTHQPFFIEIIKNTSGNILECGCGDGSTNMIREHIKDTKRKLVSLESDLAWLNNYKHLEDETHKLYHIDANNIDCIETGNKWVSFIEENKLNDFEIVFIDSSPWLSRKCCFDYFLDKAKIIIFHDFDYFPLNNIIGKLKSTEYINDKIVYNCNLDGIVKNYKLFHPPINYFPAQTGPPTLICSNILDECEFNRIINKIQLNLPQYYT